MIGGRGLFLSRSFVLVCILSIFVIIPTILLKIGFGDNSFVSFFTEPFTSFAVIIFIGMAATYQFLRPHWFSLIHISIILLGAFIYVWSLLM